jgi:hypothetical protein
MKEMGTEIPYCMQEWLSVVMVLHSPNCINGCSEISRRIIATSSAGILPFVANYE